MIIRSILLASLFLGAAAYGQAPVARVVAPISAAQLASKLDFNVPLKMRSFAEFQARVSNGEVVPFEEVESKYLPLPGDYAAVRAWLVSQGFTVTHDDARRLAVFARGTAAQIQASFGVVMQSVTSEGVTYAAASTAPILPARIASAVLGVNGLQPYLHPHRNMLKVPMAGPRPNDAGSSPYYVNQILKAYDAATLMSAGGATLTGANQKIAILIDAFPVNSDLTSFWSACGINQSLNNIEEVNVPGGAVDAASGEETLDVEWSSGIAPGAKVRVYCSDTLEFTNIDLALAQIASDVSGTSPAQPQIHELSMSLGLGETYVEGPEFTAESQYFTMIANGSTAYGGVSVFVSSGDYGSTPGFTPEGFENASGPLQPEYESTDPNVTGVGGTALLLNSNGLRSSEVVWNDTSSATGGGTSIEFARPSWQTGAGVPAGTMRLAPDVALVAAGSTPGYYFFQGSDSDVAGTSWSTPVWAGFAALINQGRSLNTPSRRALGLLNPRIYPLDGTSSFTDITSGNNAIGPNAGGLYAAGIGYDECTGLGVPDVANLLKTLLGPAISGFSPQNGVAGTQVTIQGANFYHVTAVSFNGIAAASYTVSSPTTILAYAPAGAGAGPITLTALGDSATSATNFTVPVPDLTITGSHTGSFTQRDAADTYALTVSNIGAGQSAGTVTVADTLPAGLSAVSLSGAGWSVAPNQLSASRSDALASGGSYPSLTLTVAVAANAASSVTNQVSVSGGAETNTANDVSQDATTIVPQTPSQAWRYQYFGTNANTGNAADLANPAGDGIDNLLKYALGLNPLVATVTNVVFDTSTGFLRLTVPKNPNATDITYTVQVTGNLANPTNWTGSGTTIDQNTSTLLKAHDNTPLGGAAQRFIRLQISR